MGLSKTISVNGLTYTVQNAGRVYSLTTPAPGTLRFEVRTGDVWPIDPISKNRSEIAGWSTYGYDRQVNVSYGFALEPGSVNTAAWAAVGQFHQVVSDSNSPPFTIGLIGNRMVIGIEYNDASGKVVYSPLYEDTVGIVRGHTYAMDIKATFNTNNHGHLVVVRDGVTLVDYVGSLGYVGMGGVYWKEGIYRAAATGSLAADFSNLKVTASAANLTLQPVAPTVRFNQVLFTDSGLSGRDFISVAGIGGLKGSATPGAKITVKDGDMVIGAAQANGRGAWSFKLDLAEGSHALSAGATLSGLTTWFAASKPIVVDLTPPNAPTIAHVWPDTGLGTNDAVTNTGKLSLSGASEPRSLVTIYVDGGQVGQVRASALGFWFYNNTAQGLSDGSHAVRAVATDPAGNQSPSSAVSTILVDTSPPNDQVQSLVQSDFAVAVAGLSEPGAKIFLAEGAALLASVTVGADGLWQATINEAQSAVHSYRISAVDLAGNMGPAFDLVVGGPGADLIAAPAAGDSLWGGSGNDTFILTPSTAAMTVIGDFHTAQDQIEFQGFNSATAHLDQIDAKTWRIDDGVHIASFQVSQPTILHISDYHFS